MLPYLPVLLFTCLLLGATSVLGLPPAVALAYLAASCACFAAYALDKSAARAGARRTPERTLLLLGLAGGWPGAVLAQQWLRHKTRKQPFQNVFWLTVAAHAALAGWLGWRLLAPAIPLQR
jgi:uncharacterized membrane protein YsdA (DUF1294 family)